MEKIAQILRNRNQRFNYVTDKSYVGDALAKMNSQHFDFLIVMGENQEYKGLLSEHDIISKAISLNRPLSIIQVAEVMNTGTPSADIENSVEECMKLMKLHDTRYLPVFNVHEFVGILTMEDLLQEAITHRAQIFDDKAVKSPVMD